MAGILGILSIVITGMLAWRKQLFKSGFSAFQDLYRIEMTTFKGEVRNYMNKADERHTRTLDRIAELYEKTHKQITEQNLVCKVVQGKKPIEIKAEKAWKQKIEKDLEELDKKVTHIEDCVNNKKN